MFHNISYANRRGWQGRARDEYLALLNVSAACSSPL